MKKLIVFALFMLHFLVNYVEADVNCDNPPNDLQSRACCVKANFEKEGPHVACNIQFGGYSILDGDSEESADCYGECIVNKTAILVGDKLHMDNMMKTVGEMLKNDPDYVPVMMKEIQTCYWQYEERSVELFHLQPAEPKECSTLPSYLLHCAASEMRVNCPPSKWINSTECNAIRNFKKECNIVQFMNIP